MQWMVKHFNYFVFQRSNKHRHVQTRSFKEVEIFFKKSILFTPMLSEAAIERYKINTLVFIFLPHQSTTEALWQGHTKTIKLTFALFYHKGTYVWVNIREKLCDCHKLSIGWLLLGLVILTFLLWIGQRKLILSELVLLTDTGFTTNLSVTVHPAWKN